MSCTPDHLIQSTKPLHRDNMHQLRAMQVLAVCRMADVLDPNETCDLEQLRTDSNCLMCMSDEKFQWFLTWFICRISNAIVSGGGLNITVTPGVYSGHYGGAAPPLVPASSAAIAYDLDAPYAEWHWNNDTNAWV